MTFLICAGPAAAGTICGTLTDQGTGLPVAGAGVFARLPDGSYAGALAVSDPTGAWCLSDLSPGTYTLEIRVDDYLTVYRNGIIVTDDLSDVPISLQLPAVRLDPPWPNPAASSVNLRLQVSRRAAVELDIYDLRGHRIRSWRSGSVDPGVREYQWDGRDSTGRPAPSGTYMIRLRSQDTQTTRPLILSR